MSNEIEITQWLNSDLRVENKVKNIEDDLKNGFLYRDILMRLGIPVPSSIVNKTDEASVKANYTTVGSILRDKLKITLQPRAGQHIEVLKQIFKFYQGKTLKGGSSTLGAKDQEENLVEQFNKSLKTKDKHLKESFKYEEEGLRRLMPQKIQNIESKLEKFRQQKIRSEILAKSLKDQELERENQWRIEHRQFEINKIRSNHTYIADKTKSIYKNWEKTMEIAHTRVDKEVKLNQFLTNRMKGEVKDQLDQEFKDYKQGLDYFKENCLHQGIQLAHDPDNLKPPPKSNFNMNAAMMKIREKTHKNILARKDKEKRKNRMLVEQERYEREIQAKKDEEEMLDGFIQVSAAGGLVADKIRKTQEKEAFCVVLRIEKEKQVQEERLQYFDQKHEEFRETALKNEEERKVLWKTQKLEYMEQNLERKIQKRKKHSKACLDLFDVILDVTELCYSHQKHQSSTRVQEEYWRDLMVRFGEGKPLSDEKQVTIFSEDQQLSTQPEEKEESAQIGMMFQDYNMGYGMWQPLHYFEQPEQQILNHAYNDDQLGDYLHTVIDKIYPKVPISSKPADIPDYLPLRMSIMGDRFAGKKGVAQLLKQKYGLQIIEVNEVLESAIKIAFPPPEDENDKKKNAKKAPKKGQAEEEKPENPEMKELGVLANEFKTQNQPYPDEILVKAAVVQIKALFEQLTTEQLVNQVNESKAKEDERIAGLKKEYEELQKKKEKANPKKPASKESKKDTKTKESEKAQENPVSDEPILESVEDATYRIMTQKQFEFTPGYILLNFPTNLHQAKLLEESLTGYVIPEQRLNPQGEQLKEEVAQLIRGSEHVVDTSVREGGLDLVVSLHVPAEIGEKRAGNRRLDPNTAIIYNLEDNQPNMDEKGLADRLQPIEDAQATLEKIDQTNQAFEQNMEELGPWFSQFGFEVQQQAEPSRQGTANEEHGQQGHEHQPEKQDQQLLKPNPQTSQSQRSHAEVLEHDLQEAAEGNGEEEESLHVLSSLFQKEAISRKVEVFEDIDKQISRILSIKKARIQEIVETYNKQQAELREKEQAEALLKAQQEALEKERIDAENKLIQEQNKNAAKGGNDKNAQKGAANDKNQPKNADKNKANAAAVPEPAKVEEPKDAAQQPVQEQNEAEPEQVAEAEQQQQPSADNDADGDISGDQVNHQETLASQVKLPHDADFLEAIKHENLLVVMKMWNETQKSYVKEIKEGLVKLDTHRELIASRLADVQFRFLSVVQRPDDKQHKITVFQDNLHNFFEENPQMLRFQNTKDELSEHLEHLYETLWDSVEAKKIESINERKKIMSSGWFDSEIATLFGTYLRLFQVEINKLEEIMEILLYSGDIAEGRPINEVQEHIILDPFPDGSTVPDLCDEQDTNSFPRIEKMFSHFVEKVEKIEELIDEIRMKFFKKRGGTTSDAWAMSNDKLMELYQTVLDTEKGICLYRGYVLKHSLISRVKELKLIEAALYAKLDDWIIFGLKNENDVIYEAIGQLRQSINTSTAIQPLVVQVKNISETYKILTCVNQIPAMIQPVEILREEEDVRMSIFQLKLIYEELHTLCDKRDGLSLKQYENVMIRRKKMNNNNNLPHFIKQLPDSAIMNTAKNLASQMNDGKVDFKDVMMCFILLGTPIPDVETLDQLKEHLISFSNSGYIENHSFLTVECWFDESERDDNVYGETKFHRIICLKQLIFDLFSENDPYLLSVSKYIDSLKRLSSKGKMFFWQVLFD